MISRWQSLDRIWFHADSPLIEYDFTQALSKCKDVLSLKLFEICIHTRLIQVIFIQISGVNCIWAWRALLHRYTLFQGGNLTYCNNGDFSFHCCATNYQCEDDWKGLTERNTAKAVQFLQDKVGFIQVYSESITRSPPIYRKLSCS